jgi:uncharacterized protein (UPF0212 family)
MEDPLGLSYCPHCNDNTSNIYTTSTVVLCGVCKEKKKK